MDFLVYQFTGLHHPEQFGDSQYRAEPQPPDIKESLLLNHEGGIEVFVVAEQVIKPDRIRDLFCGHHPQSDHQDIKSSFMTGDDALNRFLQIATGLASGEIGEESLERLQESYQKGTEEGRVGPLIHHLYQRGIWLYNRIRQETDFFNFAVDIPSVFRELAVKILEPLDQVEICIIGYNQIVSKILTKFRQSGCHRFTFLASDSPEQEGIIKEFSGNILKGKARGSILASTDVMLIFSPEISNLGAEALSNRLKKRPDSPMLIFNWTESDLDQLKHYSNLYLYDKQDIEYVVDFNRNQQANTLKDIQKWIHEEVKSFNTWNHSYERFEFAGIIGSDARMQRIFELISQVARTDITVLITGESGTGKELVAKALHSLSARVKKPFVVVNCGAIPDNLIESELFGHVRGAFTGAVMRKHGLFEAADSGTIFLDEISELPLHLQVKLLRALQDGEIKAVGGNQTTKINTRILAASNKNLKKLVDEGSFRSDLYYRLNVLELTVPPLRKRGGDIALLANHFLRKYSEKMRKDIRGFSSKALAAINSYDWPGNVRELENAIEHAVALCIGRNISVYELPHAVQTSNTVQDEQIVNRQKTLKEVEKKHILETLETCDWNYDLASKILGIGRTTLWRKLKEYDMISRNG